MVQMAPNKSIVSATVLAVEPYTSPDFYLLQLEITASKKVSEQLQMPGADAGDQLKAIVSKSIADELKLTKGSKVECELKKVSLDLWRIQTVSVKQAAVKKKKK
jgi:molybdopterin-binding protein